MDDLSSFVVGMMIGAVMAISGEEYEVATAKDNGSYVPVLWIRRRKDAATVRVSVEIDDDAAGLFDDGPGVWSS